LEGRKLRRGRGTDQKKYPYSATDKRNCRYQERNGKGDQKEEGKKKLCAKKKRF